MIPPGLGRRTLPGKRFCKVIIEQWEAIRCGLQRPFVVASTERVVI